jgi:hypothetical protein
MESERGMIDKEQSSKLRTFMTGLKWHGKTPEGVPRWRGSVKALPNWLINAFKFGGGALTVAGIISMALRGLDPANWVLPLIGSIYIVIGIMMQRTKTSFSALSSAEELAKAEGMTVDEVLEALRTRGIHPKVNLNDENMYDSSELTGENRLLRPSQPQEELSLLRPAGSAPTESDTLLRVADANAEPFAPQYLSADEPEEAVIQVNQTSH